MKFGNGKHGKIEPMTKQKKVVIIGGGLGGLSTAINLLDSNFEVTVLKNKNLGGKMNIFKRWTYI